MRRHGGWSGRPVRSDLDWPGLRSHYAWLPPHAGVSTTGAHQVGVSFSAHADQPRAAAGRVVCRDIRAGTAFVTGPDPITWLGVAEPTEALEIYLDRELLDGASGPPRVDPAGGISDGVVFGVASILKRAHVTGDGLTDVEASALAHRLVQHLGEAYLGGTDLGRANLDSPGTLGPAVVDRVVQYVRANLAGPITLDGLATLVPLSPYHFARAFKASTGLPPHRFVTAVRLESAKATLLSSRTSVAEVAYSVGFHNVSHFRRVFRRELGLLPGELRGDNRKNGPSGAGPSCVTVGR